MCRFVLLVVAFILIPSLPSVAQQTQPLEYTVSFEERAAHYIHVKLKIPAPATDSFALMMATWTPGSYLIREYSRHVDHVSVNTTPEVPVTIEKNSKNRWQVKCVAGKDVVVSWRVYCHEMSVRTNWVDEDMAVLCGAATFLTPADIQPVEHRVDFDVPRHWARTVTSLEAVAGREHTYKAASFDELVDSPILAGNPVLQDFDAGGINHVVASLGDSSLWDTAKATADVQRIVAQQQSFWGTVPYSRYKFLNVISEASGGLEHDNSTLVMTSRWNFRDKEKYEDWLSLMSHEFFHTWNVRRLRPANLAAYDYEAENNTRSLWVSEGITSYYEDLVLVRAGLINQASYLKRFSKNIEKLQTSPGRNVQSLAESSFDTWIKFYRPDENSANSRVSYYVKGCIVGFLLDAKTREVTNNAGSLDDVMRLLYQRHSGPKGFSETEFASIVSEVAGTDMTGWLAQHVETADELDYQQAINWFGLHFPPQDSASDKSTDSGDSNEATEPDATEPDAQAKTDAKDSGDDTTKTAPAKKPSPWLGVTTSEGSGPLVITGVIAGSPAVLAGLNVDDELLAFNQYRASSKSWKDQLKQLGTAEAIQVLISRRGIVRTLEVTLVPEPTQKWQLKPIAKPTDEQKSRLANWLGK